MTHFTYVCKIMTLGNYQQQWHINVIKDIYREKFLIGIFFPKVLALDVVILHMPKEFVLDLRDL